jgi:hypothetical protein
MANPLNCGVEEKVNFGGAAFGFEHVGDIAGGAVAEKLAQSFFVVRNSMAFNQGDEVGRCVASQRRFGKVWIRGDEVFGAAMKIREIAAAAAGDKDFFACTRGTLEDGHAPTALPCFNGAHQACGTSAENYGIIIVSHLRIKRTAILAFWCACTVAG